MRRFMQVAEVLRTRVDTGEYPPGKRIPGRRKIADEFGCAFDTVAEAVELLASEGVLEVRPRSGAYPVPADQRRPGRWRVDLGAIRRNERGYLLSAGTGAWEPIGAPAVLREPCPAAVAVELSADDHPVDEGDEVVVRRRVVGPGYAVQLTSTYLAPHLVNTFPVVAEADTGPGGWIERVEERLAAPFTGTWSAVARPATLPESVTFELPGGVNVVEAMRVISFVGRTSAVEVVVWDSRRVELVGEMTRRPEAAWPVQPATMRNSPDE
jgi:GntR family transcriptional regulator